MAANTAVRLVYKRKDGKWAWNLRVGRNIIATDGGQGYGSITEARRMADRVVGGIYKDAEKKKRDEASDGAPPE